MRKIKFLSAAFLSIFLLAIMFGRGSAKSPIIKMPSPNGIFGQNQYYSVVYDGEGEAAVAAKLVLQNNGSDKLTKTTIEIPGINIRLIRAVQESYEKEQYCVNWDQVCTKTDANERCLKYERQCTTWHWRPKTWQPLYYTLQPEANELSNSIQYSFDLKVPIKEQEQGAILLYYKVPSYAKQSRGVFHFQFETVKVPYDVDRVRVAVNVQEGLYLKGGKAETQYRPASFTPLKEMVLGSEGAFNRSLSSFSSQLPYARGYVKTTSGLDPWESFKVQGVYAKSRFALYRWPILGSIFGSLAFLAGIGVLIWWIVRRVQKRALSRSAKKEKANLLALKIIGSGIGAAIIVVILLVLSYLLMAWMNYHISYRYQTLPNFLIVLIDALLILGIVFGPALYFGIKYGASKGVWTLVTTIVTLIIIGAIVLLLYLIFFTKPHYYPTYPIYKNSPLEIK